MTASLFEKAKAPMPKLVKVKAKKKEKSCPVLANPWGKKGDSGKYFYQRYWRDLHKMNPEDVTRMYDLMLTVPFERMDSIRKLLNRYVGAGQFDKSDVIESLHAR